jgi:hypothetical protein
MSRLFIIFVNLRRLAKATLILVPLFSTYYIAFSVWHPFIKKGVTVELELTRLYFEIIWASSQVNLNDLFLDRKNILKTLVIFKGLAISLIYCFLNSEVQNEFFRILERQMLKRNPNMKRLKKPFTKYKRSGSKNQEVQIYPCEQTYKKISTRIN